MKSASKGLFKISLIYKLNVKKCRDLIDKANKVKNDLEKKLQESYRLSGHKEKRLPLKNV